MAPKTVIILCAGFGTRLREWSLGHPKPLVKIRNKPIIDFIIENYLWNDFENFIIVLGYKWKVIHRHLVALQKRLQKKYVDRNFSFIFTINQEVQRGNGFSCFLGLEKARELGLLDNIMLTMGDHLYSYKLIEYFWKKNQLNYSDLSVATDNKIDQIYIDVDEATKILGARDGVVLDIGKELTKYNRIDMGIFYLNHSIHSLAQELALTKETFGWTNVVKRAIEMQKSVMYVDIPMPTWIDVDNFHDYSYAVELFDQISGEMEVILQGTEIDLEFP